MTNFKDFEIPKQKNIADLEAVSIEHEIITADRRNETTDEPYSVSFLLIDNQEYRVPISVIKQIQEISKKHAIKTFKVIKSGEGMGTKYSVQILE